MPLHIVTSELTSNYILYTTLLKHTHTHTHTHTYPYNHINNIYKKKIQKIRNLKEEKGLRIQIETYPNKLNSGKSANERCNDRD